MSSQPTLARNRHKLATDIKWRRRKHEKQKAEWDLMERSKWRARQAREADEAAIRKRTAARERREREQKRLVGTTRNKREKRTGIN